MMLAIFSYALMAIAIGYSVWRGGAPERWFSLILIAQVLFDRTGHAIIASANYPGIANLHLVGETIALLAMAGVALAARRLWPLCAVACQMLGALSATMPFLELGTPVFASVVVSVAPSYILNLAIIVGTWRHQRRLLLAGFDRAWRYP